MNRAAKLRALVLCTLTGLACSCVTHTGMQSPAPSVPRADEKVSVIEGLTYTPSDWSEPLQADVYAPNAEGLLPGVVVVHGGSWAGRDRSDMDWISRKIAERGYVVANIDYRMAPASLYPASVDDVRIAAGWLRAQAGRFHVDPARIGGWGYSAGAHLVALAATDSQGKRSSFDAVVTCALPADLRRYPRSPIIARYLGKSFADAPRLWAEASPITHVSRQAPPMFLYHGTWDRLVDVDDSIAMHDALVQAGVNAELYLVRGNGHVSTFLLGFGAENAAIDFLDRSLKTAQAESRNRLRIQ